MPDLIDMSTYSQILALPISLAVLALAGRLPAVAGDLAQRRDDALGLPTLAIRTENPGAIKKVALGSMLFHDKRLSADGTVSCATCHRMELAHSDGLPVSEGVAGRKGTRNAPSIVNAAYLRSLFWDGRRENLEAQARDPFTDSEEHGFEDNRTLLEQIQRLPEYQLAFQQAFGVDPAAISIDHVTKAIAAFERTLVAGDSSFDRYYYGGDKAALSQSAERGLALFISRAGCAKCHTIGSESALFTDQEFHSLGVGLKRIEPRLAEIAKLAFNAESPTLADRTVSAAELAELGRFRVTKKAVDIGKFRTPSLRNVALTAPYMHDGSVPTLEAAVDLEIYYRGFESGRPLILTPAEKTDLVNFLRALTSSKFLVQER